jgi:hypothetical protein
MKEKTRVVEVMTVVETMVEEETNPILNRSRSLIQIQTPDWFLDLNHLKIRV